MDTLLISVTRVCHSLVLGQHLSRTVPPTWSGGWTVEITMGGGGKSRGKYFERPTTEEKKCIISWKRFLGSWHKKIHVESATSFYVGRGAGVCLFCPTPIGSVPLLDNPTTNEQPLLNEHEALVPWVFAEGGFYCTMFCDTDSYLQKELGSFFKFVRFFQTFKDFYRFLGTQLPIKISKKSIFKIIKKSIYP